MKRAFFMVASLCVVAAAPALGSGAFCDPPPAPQCKIGDPIGVVYGNSLQRLVDITLPTTVGPFEFIRFFDGNQGLTCSPS